MPSSADTLCCNLGSAALDLNRESRLRNPLREICTVGSVREEPPGGAMVDLNGHEAGNGGYSQGTPTAYRDSSTRRAKGAARTASESRHRFHSGSGAKRPSTVQRKQTD